MHSQSNIQLELEDPLIYINKLPVLSPVWVKMIKMLTEEDHLEEIPTILTISDHQEEDCTEEDHLEEDYQIGSLDIQEEDHHLETLETMEIKMVDSDLT